MGTTIQGYQKKGGFGGHLGTAMRPDNARHALACFWEGQEREHAAGSRDKKGWGDFGRAGME